MMPSTKYKYQEAYVDYVTNTDPYYDFAKCGRANDIPKQTLNSYLTRTGQKQKWKDDRKANQAKQNNTAINHVNAGKVKSKINHITKIQDVMNSTINIVQKYLNFVENLPVNNVTESYNYILSKVKKGDDEEEEEYLEKVIRFMIKEGYTLSMKDATELMRVLKMLSHEYAQLEGFIKPAAGSSSTKNIFMINVPIQYLTADGIKYVQDRKNNPTLIPEKDVEYSVEG
jgi:hypothetical protein